MYDVTIIGAGASGVMCALALKEKDKNLKVLLLEKNDKLGKKLSITGNGRCNLGNINNDISNFNSKSDLSNFKKNLETRNFEFLNKLDNLNNLESYYDYLIRFGVLLTKEKEYLYPYSMQAVSVCKSFERCLNHLNVEIKYNYDVLNVSKKADVFTINNDIKSKFVVIATGGKTYPKTGSTGFGYNVLKDFGHTITNLYPSLTKLKTDYKYIKDLQGVRVNAKVSLCVNEKIETKENGQVQFTSDSLSGICIFNLSRNVKKYLNENKTVKIVMDLVPDYSSFELHNYITSFPSYSVSNTLSCIISNKIAVAIAKELKFANKKMKELTDNEFDELCFTLKNMYFNIIDVGDFNIAQVTNGGAKLDEFTKGLESTKCKGLYAIGEVLDVDGKCGGYNLSWAFTSAIIAANDILKR